MCVYFCLCPTPGAAEPGVHEGHDEADLLSPLPRHGLRQALCQLLQQRHEGLSGQPGWPQHRVEASGRCGTRTHTQTHTRTPTRASDSAICLLKGSPDTWCYFAAGSLGRRSARETFHACFKLTVSPVSAETMIQVADRFDGPSGVDSVVLSLPNRISEAMLTMNDNIESINSKVRAHMVHAYSCKTADHTIWTEETQTAVYCDVTHNVAPT